MKIPIELNGLEVTKKAIADFMENAEFNEDVTEEYKRGFYDFGTAVIEALNKMQRPASSDPDTHIIIAGNGQNYEVINKWNMQE